MVKGRVTIVKTHGKNSLAFSDWPSATIARHPKIAAILFVAAGFVIRNFIP
jgi:hypothetical protein